MSRSRSPDSAMDSHDRPMSPEPEAEREPEPKRVRRESRVDDKARGKRLFGNLLGTLQKFKTEDKTSRTSEAAKRREEVAGRIAAKIRSENNLHHEIAESERELKTLRIQTDSTEYVLKHKDAAMAARHAALRPTSRFLYTTMPLEWEDPLYEGNLLNPSPIPLNHGPSKRPPPIGEPKPLYYLPKILLPHQEDALNSRIANIAELIADEAADLEKEKHNVAETSIKNRERIQELSSKLGDLRKQVRPESGRRESRDELGRTPREEMEVDVDREAGVQIRGDEGDVEVEY